MSVLPVHRDTGDFGLIDPRRYVPCVAGDVAGDQRVRTEPLSGYALEAGRLREFFVARGADGGWGVLAADDQRSDVGVPLVADRKSGAAGNPRPLLYAVFCLKKKRAYNRI